MKEDTGEFHLKSSIGQQRQKKQSFNHKNVSEAVLILESTYSGITETMQNKGMTQDELFDALRESLNKIGSVLTLLDDHDFHQLFDENDGNKSIKNRSEALSVGQKTINDNQIDNAVKKYLQKFNSISDMSNDIQIQIHRLVQTVKCSLDSDRPSEIKLSFEQKKNFSGRESCLSSKQASHLTLETEGYEMKRQGNESNSRQQSADELAEKTQNNSSSKDLSISISEFQKSNKKSKKKDQMSFNLSRYSGNQVVKSFDSNFIKKPREDANERLFMCFLEQKNKENQQKLKNLDNEKAKKIYEIPVQLFETQVIEKTKLYEIPLQFCNESTKADAQIQTSRTLPEAKAIYEVPLQFEKICQFQLVSQIYCVNYFPMGQARRVKIENVIYEEPSQMQIEKDESRIENNDKSQTNPPKIVRQFDQEEIMIQLEKKNIKEIEHIHLLPCESINLEQSPSHLSIPKDKGKKSSNLNLYVKKNGINFGNSMVSSESVVLGGSESQNKKLIKQIPSLSDHPELNFCASQTLNDDQNNQNFKHSSFYKNAPADPNLKSTLKFKQSCIMNKPENGKINLELNSSLIMELQSKPNQIYLIDESSSEESRSNRQMQVSEKIQFEKYKKAYFNGMSPFRESSVDLADFYDLKEKKMCLEEEKENLLEKLGRIEKELISLKKEREEHLKIIDQIDAGYRIKLGQIQRSINGYDEKLVELENQLSQKSGKCEELLHSVKFKDQEISAQSFEIREREEKIQSLLSENLKLEKKCEQLNYRLKAEINERQKAIQEMNSDFDIMKDHFEEELFEIKRINEVQSQYIEKLLSQIDEKSEAINRLKTQHLDDSEEGGEVGVGVGVGQKTGQANIITIQDLQMIKQGFMLEIKRKEDYILELEVDNKRVHKEVIENIESLENERRINIEIERKNKELKEELSQSEKNNKVEREEILINFQGEIDYLRREIVSAHQEIERKNQIITHLEMAMTEGRCIQSQMKIEFIEPKEEEEEKYTQQIERVVLDYEKIIVQNQNVIMDLQERVYEYLSDALEKEKETDTMYDDLIQYQNEINAILLEKIAVEAENKRMKKMIIAYEQKMSAIGTRLIHATKQKVESMDSQKEKSSASTIKFN